MTSGISVPGHPNWFKFEFPLPTVPHAPVPSRADYSKENVAPLIEGFASILGFGASELEMVYENNDHNNVSGYIHVRHPTSGTYSVDVCSMPKSKELAHYETFAKRSQLLKLYQDNSPANIKYFQPLCSGLVSG
jgi:hypothetical protein